MISFRVSREDDAIIQSLADRAVTTAQAAGVSYPRMDAVMDLTACHANACRLNLQALAIADAFTFAHDVLGIRRHLNRKTGKLENCFVPRLAA